MFVAVAMQLLDLTLAAWCGLAGLPIWAILILAYGPGAWCAMARFAFLHETVHGVSVGRTKRIRHLLLRIGDLPSITITNYLYYRWGHIDHHRRLGRDTVEDIEGAERGIDLDVLFQIDTTRIRRKAGEVPTAPPGWSRHAVVNLLKISARQLVNNLIDTVAVPFVAVFGLPFMRQRGPEFLRDTRIQALLVTVQAAAIGFGFGWQALLYMFLAQTFFYIPIHPFYAFVSSTHGALDADGEPRQPTTSIDAGAWFTVATFALNHHVEHHDFPNVPWYRLPALRRLAPEFYPAERRNHGVVATIARAMRTPPIYAGQDLEFDPPTPE